MRRRLLNIMIGGIMAFLWLAQMAHCDSNRALEQTFRACCDNTEREAHSCCSGSCKSIESREDNTEEKKRVAFVPQPNVLNQPDATLIASILSQNENQRADAVVDTEPRYPKIWHFVTRTALPVRAPSVAS